MNTQTKKCTDPRQLTAAHITDQELTCLESFVKPACSASSPGVSRVLDTPRPVRIPMQINDSTDRFYTLYSAILCFRADLLHSCQCDSEWVTVASHSVFWIFNSGVLTLTVLFCYKLSSAQNAVGSTHQKRGPATNSATWSSHQRWSFSINHYVEIWVNDVCAGPPNPAHADVSPVCTFHTGRGICITELVSASIAWLCQWSQLSLSWVLHACLCLSEHQS